jgi:phosphohistidine phosphatase
LHDALAQASRSAYPERVDDAPERHELHLYLLRHAHAGNPSTWEGDDADRPLSDKGRHQAQRLGAFMAERGFRPDAVVASTKLRALETAQLFAAPLAVPVTTDERLAGPLDVDTLAAVLDAAGGRRAVLVGHDPDFSELAATLSGTAYLPLKKGAMCRLDVAQPLQPAGGILRWLVTPDLVG